DSDGLPSSIAGHSKTRYWGRLIGGLSIPTLVAIRWAIAMVAVVGSLVIATGITSSWNAALEIMTESTSPFHNRAGIPGVLLALAGYLLVPAIVATIVAT